MNAVHIKLSDMYSLEPPRERATPNVPNIRPSCEEILEIVAQCEGITPELMARRSRLQQLVEARHLYAAVTEKYGYGPTQAAAPIKRDHSTILHSRKKCQELLDTKYRFWRARFEQILRRIHPIITERRMQQELAWLDSIAQL